MIEHAYNAVLDGFYVFPVEPGDKTPAREGQNIIRWPQWATRSIQRVKDYWSHWPKANVGIACKPSGLLVIDCDTPKVGLDGVEQLLGVLGRYGIDPITVFDTYTVTTGSGGCHLYFNWPPEEKASQSRLSDSVDIRSSGGDHGGYVLGAGSVTHKGTYRAEYNAPVRDCPPGLVALCRQQPLIKRVIAPFSLPGSGRFEGLAKAVREADEGNRNNTLHWAACAMAEGGAPLTRAEELLSEAAAEAGLHRTESIPTIRSAYRKMNR